MEGNLSSIIKPNMTTSPPLNAAIDTTEETRFKISEVFTLLALTTIMVIGVIGNILVVYVFSFNPKRRRRRIQRFEGFLILLAIVDLFSSTVIPLSYMYLTATQYQKWHFGSAGCKIIPAILPISVAISQGVLVMISFERYHTLVKPFSDRISKIKVGLGMVAILTCGVLLAIPLMTTYTILKDMNYNIQTCAPDGREKLGVLVGSASIFLIRDLLALSFMLFLGYRTNHALTKEQSNINWDRKKLSKKSRRVLRTVIAVFACLTLPVTIFQAILYAAVHNGHIISPNAYEVVLAINTILNLLQVSNSVVNVFIYSRMHSMFRLYCFGKAIKRRRSSKWRSATYVTETEFIQLDGKQTSRQHIPLEDADSISE